MAETPKQLSAKGNALPNWLLTLPGRVAGTPQEVIAIFRSFVQVGGNYFTVTLTDAESARLLAERVVPELQAV